MIDQKTNPEGCFKGLVLLSGLIFALLIGLSYPCMLLCVVGVGMRGLASSGIGAVSGGVMVKKEG